jgi:TRAP-type C4-dicarboxylate transport system substrate-binding protein
VGLRSYVARHPGDDAERHGAARPTRATDRLHTLRYDVAVRVLTSLLLLSLIASRARSEPVAHLRFAAIAPDGTAWAREAKAFAREIDSVSGGRLTVRLYLGGIAGDDLEMGRRMHRDQLDGVLSAGTVCQEVAPAFRVLRIPGLLTNRDEASYVVNRLWPVVREQARTQGVVLLTAASLGHDVVVSRVPIDTLETLRRLKLWQWDLEPTTVAYSRAMGLHVVPLPVTDAGRAYEEGKIDGFIAIPSAIFGFQWFAQRLYLSQFPFAPVYGCVIMTAASYERLPADLRDVVQAAAAKLGRRFAEATRMQDEQLLGGLFEKQGVRNVPVPPELRAQFFEAAHAARDRLGAQVVSRELLLQVQSLLADYRSEHH